MIVRYETSNGKPIAMKFKDKDKWYFYISVEQMAYLYERSDEDFVNLSDGTGLRIYELIKEVVLAEKDSRIATHEQMVEKFGNIYEKKFNMAIGIKELPFKATLEFNAFHSVGDIQDALQKDIKEISPSEARAYIEFMIRKKLMKWLTDPDVKVPERIKYLIHEKKFKFPFDPEKQ